eukprot:jgi/Botrbrau1/3609/Bobra.0204s0006.1
MLPCRSLSSCVGSPRCPCKEALCLCLRCWWWCTYSGKVGSAPLFAANLLHVAPGRAATRYADPPCRLAGAITAALGLPRVPFGLFGILHLDALGFLEHLPRGFESGLH